MATLSYTVEQYLNSLLSYVSYSTPDVSYASSPDRVCIDNNNVFRKFLVFDCKGDNDYIIPALYSNQINSLHHKYTSGIERFIKPIFVTDTSVTVHRGATTILKLLYQRSSVHHSGCMKCTTNKNEVYYVFGGMLFDKDFNILLMPCYHIKMLDGCNYVSEVIIKISNRVFSNSDEIATMSNFIIKKLIPYFGEKRNIICYNTGNITPIIQPLPVKLEIQDMGDYICSPSEPSANFEDEMDEILKIMADDIVKSNM